MQIVLGSFELVEIVLNVVTLDSRNKPRKRKDTVLVLCGLAPVRRDS